MATPTSLSNFFDQFEGGMGSVFGGPPRPGEPVHITEARRIRDLGTQATAEERERFADYTAFQADSALRLAGFTLEQLIVARNDLQAEGLTRENNLVVRALQNRIQQNFARLIDPAEVVAVYQRAGVKAPQLVRGDTGPFFATGGFAELIFAARETQFVALNAARTSGSVPMADPTVPPAPAPPNLFSNAALYALAVRAEKTRLDRLDTDLFIAEFTALLSGTLPTKTQSLGYETALELFRAEVADRRKLGVIDQTQLVNLAPAQLKARITASEAAAQISAALVAPPVARTDTFARPSIPVATVSANLLGTAGGVSDALLGGVVTPPGGLGPNLSGFIVVAAGSVAGGGKKIVVNPDGSITKPPQANLAQPVDSGGTGKPQLPGGAFPDGLFGKNPPDP